MMGEVTKQVFMGNGGCKCSGSQVAELYALLSRALSDLSGLQQMPLGGYHGRTKSDIESEIEELQCSIKSAAEQIYVGLTGRKVIKTRKAHR